MCVSCWIDSILSAEMTAHSQCTTNAVADKNKYYWSLASGILAYLPLHRSLRALSIVATRWRATAMMGRSRASSAHALSPSVFHHNIEMRFHLNAIAVYWFETDKTLDGYVAWHCVCTRNRFTVLWSWRWDDRYSKYVIAVRLFW